MKVINLDTTGGQLEGLQSALPEHMGDEILGYALVTLHKDGNAKFSYGHGGGNIYHALVGALHEAAGGID